MLEFELASALHCIIHSHWMRLLQNATFRPSVQVGSIQCPMRCIHTIMRGVGELAILPSFETRGVVLGKSILWALPCAYIWLWHRLAHRMTCVPSD